MARLSVDARRSLLVEAATTVLLRDGVTAATTRAICAEAGMPQSAFHYCYDSRTDLLRVAITEMLQQLAVPTDELIEATAPEGETEAIEYVENLLVSYVQSIADAPDQHAISLELAIAGRHDPELAELSEAFYQVYLDTFGRIIKAAAVHLGGEWDQDDEVLSTRLLALVEGIKLVLLTTGRLETLLRVARSVALDIVAHLRPRSSDRATSR